MVRKGNEAWKIADVYPSSFETDLQELIISDPSILPITNIREGASELVLAIKEVSIRGKSIDVLGFTRDGDIAIIECKLAKNEEARRKVIGQILEYAAYLWRLNYDELDDIIKNNYGKSLIELIQENSSESLDEETFIKNVGNNLKSGSFMLLIATDRINETLEKIIKFINEASQSNFSLHVIELKRFRSGDIEILLPYIHGLTEKPTESVKTARYWNEESFFSELESNANEIEYNLIKDFYNYLKNLAEKHENLMMEFGKGAKIGTINVRIVDKSNYTLMNSAVNFPSNKSDRLLRIQLFNVVAVVIIRRSAASNHTIAPHRNP